MSYLMNRYCYFDIYIGSFLFSTHDEYAAILRREDKHYYHDDVTPLSLRKYYYAVDKIHKKRTLWIQFLQNGRIGVKHG